MKLNFAAEITLIKLRDTVCIEVRPSDGKTVTRHAVTRRVTVTVTCWYCVTRNTNMLIRKKGLLLKLWINRNKRVRKLISKPIDLFSSFDRETTSINNQYILKKNRKRSNGRTVEWLNRGISLNAECFVV